MKASRVGALLSCAELSVFGFAALFAAAMALYPGGTWYDRAARGHHFWSNYLCDLQGPVALNGADNRWGALFAQSALVLLGLGLLALWIAVGTWPGKTSRAARNLRLFAALATPGLLIVPLVPTAEFGKLHGLVVLVSAPFSFVAFAHSLLALGPIAPTLRTLATFGWAVMTLALLVFALYAFAHLTGRELRVLPAAQKVVLLLTLAWLLLGSRALRGLVRTLSSPQPG